jgi:LysR family glycine cleavage system transcriptional activator
LFVSSAHKPPPIPLTALRQFEAVMRLGTMTRAADSLGVTHGAISRNIVALQDRLGFVLFEGPRNARRPTAAAEALYLDIGPVFERLAMAISVHAEEDRHLRVSCLSTLAGRWLIPRLAHWPFGEDIELTESYADLNRSLEGTDLAIRMLAGDAEPPPGLVAVPFMANEIGPVLSPGLDPGRARRLLSRSHPSAIDDWTTRYGHLIDDTRPPMWFDHQQTMIEACLAGLGVCVTQRPLIAPDLASGRLVAPYGFSRDGAAFAVFHRTGQADTAIRRFIRWLCEQGGRHQVRPNG